MLAAGSAAVMGPWGAYNASRYGELILVNDAFGYNLWRGAHREVNTALETSDPATYRSLAQHFETVTSPTAANRVALQATSPGARSRAWAWRAVRIIRDEPNAYARTTLRKLARYWRPWLDPKAYTTSWVVVSGVLTVSVFLLASAGLARLWRSDRWSAAVVLGWLILFWLAHAPFQVVMRFRVPPTEPIAVVLAVLTLARLHRSSHRFGIS